MSEPEREDDPAAQVTLTVVRSGGGEGAVALLWQLEGGAARDLSPLNGTLVFTEVWSTAPSGITQHTLLSSAGLFY